MRRVSLEFTSLTELHRAKFGFEEVNAQHIQAALGNFERELVVQGALVKATTISDACDGKTCGLEIKVFGPLQFCEQIFQRTFMAQVGGMIIPISKAEPVIIEARKKPEAPQPAPAPTAEPAPPKPDPAPEAPT